VIPASSEEKEIYIQVSKLKYISQMLTFKPRYYYMDVKTDIYDEVLNEITDRWNHRLTEAFGANIMIAWLEGDEENEPKWRFFLNFNKIMEDKKCEK